MMVFSGLLKSSSHGGPRRAGSATALVAGSKPSDPGVEESDSSHGSSNSLYICHREHLQPIEAEDPDLRELNNSVEALAAIFPDVQIEVFREMLATFDEESRLAVVTEALLKNKMKWARGRYRVADKQITDNPTADRGRTELPTTERVVATEDKFRSADYKKAVKTITYHEFKGLPRSTINAVLAEFNNSYTLARPTLVALSSKSWRFSISSIFLRRKGTLSREEHPLVTWQSTGQGSIVPTLKTTGSAELDQELFDSLIAPIQTRLAVQRAEKDHAMALELNATEAEQNDALHDCECCYTSAAFEELTACDDGGHLLCFQCVRHSVNEAVFGQGWQRNIDLSSGTLRCVAAMSDECKGCIPQDLVRRAFNEDKTGEDVLRKFDERLAEAGLLQTGLRLIRCPFCSYAEVDDLYLPASQRPWRIRQSGVPTIYTCTILILGVGMIPLVAPLFLAFSLLFLLFSSPKAFGTLVLESINASVTRMRRKRHGLKFVCQGELCGRSSCISCSKGWTDIHICHESSLVALRTRVELAMSAAIKRTCPRCNTSFVKSSGCNKLTCICGYQMCYVCRKDIGNGEGYRHFCEHFRPNGGRGCTDCTKCDLYRCEDDEVVVKKAKEEAERQWLEKEGTDIGDEDIKKALVMQGGQSSWMESKMWQRKMPDWEASLDAFIESVLE